MTQPLPVTIIAGYLGAGKTTLVNQMLRQAHGVKLAILVNEFGALPIDEDLIIAQDDDLISIAGGCICCSFGSDLSAALIDIANMSPRPDHIVIECSGVALPGAIYHSIALLDHCSVAGIVVLADGAQITAQLADEFIGDTIERQLDDADLVLLTKTDLIADADAVEALLTARWPAPALIRTAQGKVPNDVLLGTFDMGGKSNAAHHDGAYDSVALAFENGTDIDALTRALTHTANGVVRAKGCVLDQTTGERRLIQLVGPRVEVTDPEPDMPRGLICIGLKGRLDVAALRALDQ